MIFPHLDWDYLTQTSPSLSPFVIVRLVPPFRLDEVLNGFALPLRCQVHRKVLYSFPSYLFTIDQFKRNRRRGRVRANTHAGFVSHASRWGVILPCHRAITMTRYAPMSQ